MPWHLNICIQLSYNFYTFLYINNLFAKAPVFNLDKKVSNLLSNREALN